MAATEARKAALWFGTALAGIAGIVFGTGPFLVGFEYLTNDIPYWRIVLALALVTAGGLSLITVVTSLFKCLRPVEFTLATLPEKFRRRVDRNPRDYLPKDHTSVARFQHAIPRTQTAIGQFRRFVHEAEREFETEVRDEEKINKEGRLKRFQLELAIAERRLLDEKRFRATLLAQAELAEIDDRLCTEAPRIRKYSVAVLFSAAFYLIVVSGKSAPPPSPSAALLTVQKALVDMLGVGDCVGADNTIPVLLFGGTGTVNSPWDVQTFGAPDDCPAFRFSIGQPGGALRAAVPQQVTIPSAAMPSSSAPMTTAPPSVTSPTVDSGN